MQGVGCCVLGAGCRVVCGVWCVLGVGLRGTDPDLQGLGGRVGEVVRRFPYQGVATPL